MKNRAEDQGLERYPEYLRFTISYNVSRNHRSNYQPTPMQIKMSWFQSC